MTQHAQDKENYIAYVLGRVETQVEGYATSGQIPFSELSRIVGEFLCSKASGQLLRSIHSMPTLLNERKRAGRPRKEGRPAMAKVAVLGNAHSNVSGWSAESRAKLSKAMKLRWAQKKAASAKPIHWTQTPKGREYMAKRAKKFWKEGTWKGRAQK